MNTIMVYVGINSTVQFNTCHLGSIKLLFAQDVVYVVVMDFTESSTHTATYSGLLTI